jgi:hypothetical protein
MLQHNQWRKDMPITGDAKREANKKAWAIKKATRALTEKVELEPAQDVQDVLAHAALMDDDRVLIQDARPEIHYRYRSEVRSCTQLAMIFLGIMPERDEEEEDKKKKKKRVLKPCSAKILGRRVTFDEWLELRDKARKNLFWLCYELLRLRSLNQRVHGPVCDMFVKKDFDGVYYEGYTLEDMREAIHRFPREKRMLLLFPRGFYKTVINCADCVQWFLNAPDCMISILSGTEELADDFLGEVKKRFNLQSNEDPTDFHLLFPEYILTGIKGTSNEDMWCPAAINHQKDASLWVRSIKQGISGKHADVRKMDDVVTNSNSENEDARKSLKAKIDSSKFIVGGHGFTDIVGTRYFSGKVPDYYGTLIGAASETNPLKEYCRGVWTVKAGFEKVNIHDLEEHMVDLLFPEKIGEGFNELMAELGTTDDEERQFRNQKLNDPTDAEIVDPFRITFDIDVLKHHEYSGLYRVDPRTEGDIFVTGDWAYSDNKWSDWSVLVAGRTFKRASDGKWGFIILEVKFGKWKYSELAFQIVMFAKKWNPKKVMLEEITGGDILKREIAYRCMIHEYSFQPLMMKPDQSKGAKKNRIKQLEILLNDDLMFFVGGDWIEETFKQFVQYKGEKSTKARKDDIPDAIGYLHQFLPTSLPSPEMAAQMKAAQDKAMREHMKNAIFGGGQSASSLAWSAVQTAEQKESRNTPFNIPGIRPNRGRA